MATTEIHMITTTPEKALQYVISDKVVQITDESEIRKDVPYISFSACEKLYVKYLTTTTTINCIDKSKLMAQYSFLRDKYSGKNNCSGKTKCGGEVVMWHLHQSFNGHEVDSATANEIGRKLAEEVFKGFTVTISTHVNTDNIHNHLIISAWNKEGKKWNDCHRTKREIRKVSDRLCEEYGLSVLEKTRNMNLIKYKDKDGKTRYYEPTDRKNEIIRKREAGEATTDDVRSYRNTPAYEQANEKRESNRTVIQSDIDNLLPACKTYFELLDRLRDMGYTIKDKKNNGEWLSHISFQAPLQDKATREDKIGTSRFYTRENLEKYFSFKEKEHDTHREEVTFIRKTIPLFESYAYGKTDLSQIDDSFKTVRAGGDVYDTVPRTEAEKKLLADVRIKDNQVRGLINTERLHKIIQQQEKHPSRKYSISPRVEERLVAQIRSSFQCLSYTEHYNIYSYQQIINLYKANKDKYDNTIQRFTDAGKMIAHLKGVLLLPEKATAIREKMQHKQKDIAYIMESYDTDKVLLKQYTETMEKYKIDTPQGLQTLKEKVSTFETKQSLINGYVQKTLYQMAQLENCMRTFDRIDREHGAGDDAAIKQFEKLVIHVTDEREDENKVQKEKGTNER
ncbi:endonuclease relaxase, MobA/VirD2 family protein (plasmid) [Oscillibacter valericigenes Sjm18-20]|nr:endonuclease relaxase, MobA/VirD2 family protein [Oscillibacter valericigenes Sjm18-20]